MNRLDREWLQDILEAIGHVERYTGQGREPFDHNELIRVWTLYHIQIIGEAAAHLSDELTEQYSHVPWSQIVGMRNILVHAYFSVVDDQVWNTVERDLPILKAEIEEILQKI